MHLFLFTTSIKTKADQQKAEQWLLKDERIKRHSFYGVDDMNIMLVYCSIRLSAKEIEEKIGELGFECENLDKS